MTAGIGRFLRLARVGAGLSLRETSKNVGMSPVRLTEIELYDSPMTKKESDSLHKLYSPTPLNIQLENR